MPVRESMPLIARLFITIFFSIWFWHAYLMVARPRRWVDWMYVKPLRWWGLSVTVENEQKLNRKARVMGIFFVLFGLLFIGFVTLAR